MKDRINGDAISGRLIKDLEWESPQERSAKLVHCDRIEPGMSLDGEHARLHAAQEILAQPRFASLIPIVCIGDILLGLGCVNDTLNHFALAPAV